VFIPVSASVKSRGIPWVNLGLIAFNVWVYVYMSSYLDTRVAVDQFFYDWGLNSTCLATKFGIDAQPTAGVLLHCPSGDNVVLTIVSSMFVHAGFMHLATNMLFLWVFGGGVEDRLGHVGYLLFYVLCGIAANITQVAFSLDSTVLTFGASGAIAGVMAAYALLFPMAKIRMWLLVTFEAPLPAIALLFLWLGYQVAEATGQFGWENGGVAWWAHIGGFVAGLVLVWFLKEPEPVYVPVAAEPEAASEPDVASRFSSPPRW
jgi:membrane associated rhomboid family serine protease